MSIVLKIGDKFPKSCNKCPLFIDGMLGCEPFCASSGEHTEEEIDAEEDGNLNMYYHGHLKNRPKNCPLVEIKEDTRSEQARWRDGE